MLKKNASAAPAAKGSDSPRSKTPRTEGTPGDSGSLPSGTITVAKSELSLLLDTKFETAAKRSENHLDTAIKSVRDEMQTMDAKHDTKHADTANAITALETKLNAAVESFTNIAATNATTMHETAEAAVLSARAAMPHGVGNLPFAFAAPPEDGYHRAPLPDRLKLFAADPITLDAARLGAKAMCDKAGISQTNYVVKPLGNPGLSRLFAIDFIGSDDSTNKLRAKKARECLRNPNGSWDEMLVATPTGTNTKAYINADKSPKVERVEKLSKILFKICKQEFTDKNFFLDRATDTIKCGWTPIAIVSAPSSAEISLKWNNGGLEKTGIRKEVLKDAFDLATGGSANVEWSS